MQDRIETVKPTSTDFSYTSTPYMMANLAAKTAGISFTVSLVTQPFNSLLTRLQMSATTSILSGGLFRGLYRGFLPHAVAGQQRGAIAVTSKHAHKEPFIEEEFEAEIALRNKWLGTLAFAQADHLVSNALYGKSKLTSAGTLNANNFHWSIYNIYQLTKVNWGSRSIAGFINFAAIGFVGDHFSSYYHFKNELLNKICGGATAGVFATFFTTLPNAYADRKLLATKVENKRIITTSPFTLFSQAKNHIIKHGVKNVSTEFAYNNFLKEFIIRSPQAALTFATILAMDHLIGSEPLKALWPLDEQDLAEKETIIPYEPPSRKM